MRGRHSIPVGLAVLAVAAVVLALVQTRLGPGASGDSTSYIMGAQNILAGNGFSRYSGGYEVKPITGFPPLFSVALATIGFLGIDMFTAARLLNAALFGANVLLVGLMIFRYSASAWASALGGLLFLTADTPLELHTWVMSEPLYIFLTLAGIYALANYLDRAPIGWLAAAGILTALSSVTRLVGPALTAAGVLGILAFGPAEGKRRSIAGAGFALLSLTPLTLWLQRNSAAAGTWVNRELAYHPMDLNLIRLFLAEISSWFVPHEVPLPTAMRAMLAVLLAAALFGGFLISLGRKWVERNGLALRVLGPDHSKLRSLPWMLAGYVVFNALILFINSTFLDASTTMTAPPRYLAPIFAALVPLGVLAGSTLVSQLRRRSLWRSLLTAYAGALVAFYGANSLAMVRDPLPHLGYTGRKVVWTELVTQLERVPTGTPIVSNNPEMVYILAGRPAYVRPIHYDHYQEAYREDYREQFAFIAKQMEQGGVFVVFDQLEQDDLALIEGLDLRLIEEYPRAKIYR